METILTYVLLPILGIGVLLIWIGIGQMFTIEPLEREDEWNNKTGFIINSMLCLLFPLFIVGGILYALIWLLPQELYKWWSELPDTKHDK